jgi:type IV secretory pathway VirB10-like protein
VANRQKALGDIQAWLDGVAAGAAANTSGATPLSDVEAQNAPTALPPKVLSLQPTEDIIDEAPPPPSATELEEAEKRADNKYTRALRAEKARLAEQDRLRKEQQAKEDEVTKTVRATGALLQSVAAWSRSSFGKARSRLEGIPTPGDIWVPLALLLIFFLVLFPVNGHSRLMWLWMTITGNAQIGGALPQPTMGTPPPILNPGQQASLVAQQLYTFAQGSLGPTAGAPPATGGGPMNGRVSGNYGQLLQDTHNLN